MVSHKNVINVIVPSLSEERIRENNDLIFSYVNCNNFELTLTSLLICMKASLISLSEQFLRRLSTS